MTPGAEDCALDRAEPVEATLRDLHERVLTIEASLGLPISIADKLIACEIAKRRWVDPGEARRRRLKGSKRRRPRPSAPAIAGARRFREAAEGGRI
jgi:hypothetical protein